MGRSPQTSHSAKPEVGTLLMVGSRDVMDAALQDALKRHGMLVERVATDALSGSVRTTAPDVILLVGDAARDGGQGAIERLAADPATAAVPVVLLATDARLQSKIGAFRHGATAVVARSPSADKVAREIVRLSKDLSTHFEEKTGEIGEATFDELIDLVKQELRSGILSVHAPGHKGGPMRVVLGAGRSVAEAVDEFVGRLKPYVESVNDKPMYYQFHTSAGGPVELLDSLSPSGASRLPDELDRLRVLLVDNDPARADALAQELRNGGALVFVTDESGRGLERAAGLDPQVTIVDQKGLEGRGFEVVRRLRKDLRMRWASILVAPWSEIWPSGEPLPSMGALLERIEPLVRPEQDLFERARAGEPFDVRLEATGPGRLLRLLVESGHTLHLTVRNPKATVDIDVAQGLIVGATAQLRPAGKAEGSRALAALLALGSGRVHIEPRENPAVANIMSPIDEALSAAQSEPSPIKPSLSPSYDDHIPFEDDDEGDASNTRVKDLTGLANAAEAILERKPVQPATQPKPAPGSEGGDEKVIVAPPRRRRRRQPTLPMGAGMGNAAPPPRYPPKPPVAREPDILERETVRPEPSDVLPATREEDLPPDIPDAPPIGLSDISALADPSDAGSSPVSLGELADELEGEPPPERTAPFELQKPVSPPASAIVEPPAPEAVEPASDPFEPDVPDLSPDDLESVPPTPVPPAMPPEPAIASPEPHPSTTEDTHKVPLDAPEPRRRGRGLLFAALTLLALPVLVILALVGYRASGLHQPQLDALLVMVGAAPTPEPDTPETPDTPEPETPEPETPEPETPETPEPETPETPEPETPETPEPETPEPETPEPETPETTPGDPAEQSEELVRQARRAGESDLAVGLYRQALERDSRNHHAMVGLGRLLLSRNQPSEAVGLLRGAVQRRPRRAAYRVYLGDALAATGDGAGAREEYQRALELDPDDPRVQSRANR